MKTSADKTQKSKKSSVAIGPSQRKGGYKAPQFIDSRPEAIVQRRLVSLINSSSEMAQLMTFQEFVDNRPEVAAHQKLQKIANSNGPTQRAAKLGADMGNLLPLKTSFLKKQTMPKGGEPRYQLKGKESNVREKKDTQVAEGMNTIKFKGADQEVHSVYTEGEPGNKKLMIASTPEELLQVLYDHQRNFYPYYESINMTLTLELVIQAAEKLKSLRYVRVTNRGDDWDDDKELWETTLRSNLGRLAPHLMWGNSAWNVDWIKPITSNYPPIWIGPSAAGTILQSSLAWYRHFRSEQDLINIKNGLTPDEWISWVGKGNAEIWAQYWSGGYWLESMPWPYVEIYYPERGGTLPNGTVIGLASENRIYQGREFDVTGDTSSTPGGAKINDALGVYGYKATMEGLDGDHARECQLGGQDSLKNLWPLEGDANRAGGVWLNKTRVYDNYGHSMPYPVLVDLVGTGSLSGVKLKLNIINDSNSERWGWRS